MKTKACDEQSQHSESVCVAKNNKQRSLRLLSDFCKEKCPQESQKWQGKSQGILWESRPPETIPIRKQRRHIRWRAFSSSA
jgi:hypothetical protein